MPTPTPDRWSMEETRQTSDGAKLAFKPYAAFKMFAVFRCEGGKCKTLYDGGSEAEARRIFETNN